MRCARGRARSSGPSSVCRATPARASRRPSDDHARSSASPRVRSGASRIAHSVATTRIRPSIPANAISRSPWFGVGDAERGQHALLAQRIEADDRLRPQAVDEIETVADRAHPSRPGSMRRCRSRPRAELDARGAHRRGRIDAHPAASGDPHFGPRVRIGIAHQQIAAGRIPPAALIAGDDARRDSGRAHQDDERRCVVLAETLLRREQKIVDRVAAEQRRIERVGEALVEQVERRAHDRCVVEPLRPPAFGKRARARIETVGQLRALAHARASVSVRASV